MEEIGVIQVQPALRKPFSDSEIRAGDLEYYMQSAHAILEENCRTGPNSPGEFGSTKARPRPCETVYSVTRCRRAGGGICTLREPRRSDNQAIMVLSFPTRRTSNIFLPRRPFASSGWSLLCLPGNSCTSTQLQVAANKRFLRVRAKTLMSRT